jgi:cytochrome c5
VRTADQIRPYSLLIVGVIAVSGLATLAPALKSAPSPAAPAHASLIHSVRAPQDGGQAAPGPATPAAPKPVELPDGPGKPIATEFCQDCHRLTNLTKAHKNLEDWKDTIHAMMDRGARIPDEKIDTLAQYLSVNFGPRDEAAATTQGSSPATPPAAGTPAPPSAPGTASAPAVVELPEGEGKAIATENCQACHKLTNLTKAHKNLDDWKETVQTMIDRGANVPPEKVDVLVQYLAKNFGPKDPAAPASGTSPASAPIH